MIIKCKECKIVVNNFRFKTKLFSGIKKETYDKILNENKQVNAIKQEEESAYLPNDSEFIDESAENHSGEQLEIEVLESNKFVACKEHLTGETVLFCKRDIMGLKGVQIFSQHLHTLQNDTIDERVLQEPDNELLRINDNDLSQALLWNYDGYSLLPGQTLNVRRAASIQARQTYFDMLTMIEIYNQLIRIAPNENARQTLQTLNNEMRILSITMLNIYRQLSANIVTPRPPRFVPIGSNFCRGLNIAINQLDIILFDLIRLTRLVNIQSINRQLFIMITVTQNQTTTLNRMYSQHCGRIIQSD